MSSPRYAEYIISRIEFLRSAFLAVLRDFLGNIRHSSVHKAKSLESNAVILIDKPPHTVHATAYDQHTCFMPTSRARRTAFAFLSFLCFCFACRNSTASLIP